MDRRALILDGSISEDRVAQRLLEFVQTWLAARDWNATVNSLRDLDVAPCLGCFGCWIKTPGECVIDDAGRDVARSIVGSDVVVYLTPILFGGYSYELKKAVDRSIPIISPYFRVVNGEVHHKPRYASYPNVAALAWGVDGIMGEEKDTFATLVKRNAINMMARRIGVGFVASDEPHEMDVQVARVLEEVCGP